MVVEKSPFHQLPTEGRYPPSDPQDALPKALEMKTRSCFNGSEDMPHITPNEIDLVKSVISLIVVVAPLF